MIWRSLRIRPLFLGSSLRLKGGYEFGGAGKHVRPVRLTTVSGARRRGGRTPATTSFLDARRHEDYGTPRRAGVLAAIVPAPVCVRRQAARRRTAGDRPRSRTTAPSTRRRCGAAGGLTAAGPEERDHGAQRSHPRTRSPDRRSAPSPVGSPGDAGGGAAADRPRLRGHHPRRAALSARRAADGNRAQPPEEVVVQPPSPEAENDGSGYWATGIKYRSSQNRRTTRGRRNNCRAPVVTLLLRLRLPRAAFLHWLDVELPRLLLVDFGAPDMGGADSTIGLCFRQAVLLAAGTRSCGYLGTVRKMERVQPATTRTLKPYIVQRI